ncbi:hypothetical protein AAM22_gp16 [Pantoea phage vB_PagM_AAM22]|nr:hypothetical protein AAM22_gp16 [Pantoea phage vB_PagM_AAM22]
MNEVKRHSVSGYGRQDICYNDPEGEFVYYEDYATLKAKCDALAAENAEVRASIPEERFIDILNENMDDVSLAEDIGYNTAVKEMRRDIETPATDAYLNSVRAEGVDMFISELAELFKTLKTGGKPWQAVKGIAVRAASFANQLRAGEPS